MALLPESHRDLADAQLATMATIGPDGRPQVTIVWFLVEDDVVRISLNETRQKVANLRTNPACTLVISDPSGYRYVEIRGDATVEPDEGYAFAQRLAPKYGGADVRDFDPPGTSRVVATLRPVKVNATDMTGG